MLGVTTQECTPLMDQIIKERHIHPQEEYRLCEELEDYAVRTHNTYALCFAKLYQSDSLYHLGQVEAALHIGRDALELQTKYSYYNLILVQVNIIGIIYTYLDNEQSALEYFLRGLKLAKLEEHQHMMLSAIYYNLASLYLGQTAYKQAEEAIHYAQEAYEQAQHNDQNVNTTRQLQELFQATLAFQKEHYDEVVARTSSILHTTTFEETPFEYLDTLLLQAKTYCKLQEYRTMQSIINEVLSHSFASFSPLVCYSFYKTIIDLCLTGKWTTPIASLLEKWTPYLELLNLPNKWVAYYDCYIQYACLIGDSSMEQQLYEHYYQWSCKQELTFKQMTLSRIQGRNALYATQRNKERVQKLREQLQHMASFDELTGIANRHGLNQYLRRTFQMAKAEHMTFCLLLIDVDYFKEYNDTYGHLMGDRCLQLISSALTQTANQSGFVARYGGDEFMVIFINLSYQEVQDYAASLLTHVSSMRIEHSTSKASDFVSLTIGGVHHIPTATSDILDYIHAADNALYHIKRTTRNNYYISETC